MYSLSIENQQSKSIYEGRKAVLEILHNYRIEYDFNRMDFLTVIDIDSGELTESEEVLGELAQLKTLTTRLLRKIHPYWIDFTSSLSFFRRVTQICDRRTGLVIWHKRGLGGHVSGGSHVNSSLR